MNILQVRYRAEGGHNALETGSCANEKREGQELRKLFQRPSGEGIRGAEGGRGFTL